MSYKECASTTLKLSIYAPIQGLSSVKVEKTKRSPEASRGVIRLASLTVEVFLAVSLYFIFFQSGRPARSIAVSLTLFKRGWGKSSQLDCEIFLRFEIEKGLRAD